jgi:hypothetical protein
MSKQHILIGGMGAIRSHLFVLAPNNSGSTFLTRALAHCCGAWSLPREGQHVQGFVGPTTRSSDAGLLWGASPEKVAQFADQTAYDWERNRMAWHFQATASSQQASVLVVSSPPFLLFGQELAARFPNARFLIMVRDPYAVVEGIIRGTSLVPDNLEIAQLAAQHVVTTFQYQQRNLQSLAGRLAYFSYEAMCSDPASVATQILALVPDLGPVDLNRKIAVKGNYDESLRDMNADQIARLSPAVIDRINHVFDGHRPVLDSFGFERLIP